VHVRRRRVAGYDGAANGWAARRGRAARADWASRAVAWRFLERRMDRRALACLGVRTQGEDRGGRAGVWRPVPESAMLQQNNSK
jgi:hypothetical protein